MDRRSFLGRSLAAIAGLYGLRAMPAPAPPMGVIRDSLLTSTNEFQLFRETFESGYGNVMYASGGLCAPLTPVYEILPLGSRTPVRDSLPAFRAVSGDGKEK